MNPEKLIVPLAFVIGLALGWAFWYITGEITAFVIVFVMITSAPFIYRIARRRDEKRVSIINSENASDKRDRFLQYAEKNGFKRAENMVSDVKKRYRKFEFLSFVGSSIFFGVFSVAGLLFFDELADDLFSAVMYIFFIIAIALLSIMGISECIACMTAFPMRKFLKNTSFDIEKLNESYCTSGAVSNGKCGISTGGDYIIVFKILHFIVLPASDIKCAIKTNIQSRSHTFYGSSYKTEILYSVVIYTHSGGFKRTVEVQLTEHQCELVCDELMRKGIEVQSLSHRI